MTESLLAGVISAAVSPAMPEPAPLGSHAPDSAALASARSEGEAAGRVAERARIQAIMSSGEADGRAALAAHLAFSTDTSPDAAIGLLRVAGKEIAPPSSRLDGLVPDPKISIGSPAPPDMESSLNSAVERFNAARRG